MAKEYPNEQVFVENSTYQRGKIKRKIVKQKLLPYECAECGLKDLWNNKKLVLRLDHINGVNDDHRFENLRFLCPNCDSQQSTYSGRNAKKNRNRAKV